MAIYPSVDIGKNSNKLKVTHTNANGETNNETFNFALSIAECKNTVTAAAIDSWARQFVNLSTDTYGDSIITSVKILESISGGEG